MIRRATKRARSHHVKHKDSIQTGIPQLACWVATKSDHLPWLACAQTVGNITKFSQVQPAILLGQALGKGPAHSALQALGANQDDNAAEAWWRHRRPQEWQGDVWVTDPKAWASQKEGAEPTYSKRDLPHRVPTHLAGRWPC